MRKTISVLITACVLAVTDIGTSVEAASVETTMSRADYLNGYRNGEYERAAAVTNDDLLEPYYNARAQQAAAAQAGDYNAFDY